MNWYKREIFGGRYPSIPLEKQLEIIEFYNQSDFSVKEILDTFGISEATLYRILNRHNIPRSRWGARIPPDFADKVVEEYQDGVGIESLVVKYNLSRRHIENELKARGIPIRSLQESQRTPAFLEQARAFQGSPEARKRKSESMKAWWEAQGGFWSHMATLPLEQRLKTITRMVNNSVRIGRYSPQKAAEIISGMHAKARQLDEMPAAHKPYATGDDPENPVSTEINPQSQNI